jgi:hypothetical protein
MEQRFERGPAPNSPPLLFMLKTQSAEQCASLRGEHVNGRSCKRKCTADEPRSAHATLSRRERNKPPRWIEAPRATPDAAGGAHIGWAGNQTADERRAALSQCGAETTPSTAPAPANAGLLHCGFQAQSAFDAARDSLQATAAHCEIVVLTAILGGLDQLRQPLYPLRGKSGSCFFAFVDRLSHTSRGATTRGGPARPSDTQGAPGAKSAPSPNLPSVGVWQLVLLAGALPFGNSRRDSRIPKMLPHRLFPRASFCIWVDGKLQLTMQPEQAIARYLADANADIAAVRNLRRDTIDHEFAWIDSWLCPKGPAPSRPALHAQAAAASGTASAACEAVRAQMKQYELEQKTGASSSTAAAWKEQTSVIEGALLFLDLRSTATQCFLCNWFNEYVRFGERDQLAFSYVMHVQRPRPNLLLLPRRLHWSVTVEDDTALCYNATEDDARTLALRFQHASGAARAPYLSLSRRTRPARKGV